MEPEIKLSIGIPTYNNPTGLKKQLDNILTQLENSQVTKGTVEVFVSDNSDNKDTSIQIGSFISKIKNLEYIKNKENLGYDRNVDQILTKTKGMFCWLLSDNDPIDSDAIEKILNVIQENPDIGHILIDTSGKKEKSIVFNNMEDAITAEGYEIPGGLVSSNIFNKKLLTFDRSKYYYNDWIHMATLLEACAKNKVILIPNIIEKDTDDNCRWAKNGKTFETYTHLQSIFNDLVKYGYTEGFVNVMNRKFIRGLPHQIVTAKLHGLKVTNKNIGVLYRNAKYNKPMFILCFLILIVPVSFLIIFKKIWKKS
jgi:glycosyltransferase involved in cell wall biosynthesis